MKRRRIAPSRERVLARLEQGPATTSDLSRIALRFGARIYELRGQGYRISAVPVATGVTRYSLHGRA